MYKRVVHASEDFEAPSEVLERMRNPASDSGHIDETSLSGLKRHDVSRHHYRYLKRLIDIVGSVIGLFILFLPLCLVALVIYVDDPGPVFFRQHRVGLYGKRFRVYKFRSMKTHTPKYMSTMNVEDPTRYITRVGKWIRKLSIDELPQLFNVLIGDMSFVGPRPLISDEYEIHQVRMKYGVYTAKPGITGLAQIHGRDWVSPEDKVRWDVMYLEKYGFWSDIKILLATIPVILGSHGVAEGFDSTKKSA